MQHIAYSEAGAQCRSVPDDWHAVRVTNWMSKAQRDHADSQNREAAIDPLQPLAIVDYQAHQSAPYGYNNTIF
jgi:hypothetical protein